RREEAQRDPADGAARAAPRDPRRNRLGPRHRRIADRRRRHQRAAESGTRDDPGHPLPAAARLRRARLRPRARARTLRQVGRQGARAGARAARLWLARGRCRHRWRAGRTMSAAVDRFVADFARHAKSLPGAHVPWVARLREDAITRFAERGLPTTRDEDWKYTNVAPIAKRDFALVAPGAQPDVDIGAFLLDGDATHRLVFVDGRYAPTLSAIGRLPAGVTLESLASVLARGPDALEAWFAADAHETVFASLNTAFMSDGVHLRLSRGIVLDAPIHALFISTAAGAAVHPRNVIVAEDGARATLIEHYVGVDG